MSLNCSPAADINEEFINDKNYDNLKLLIEHMKLHHQDKSDDYVKLLKLYQNWNNYSLKNYVETIEEEFLAMKAKYFELLQNYSSDLKHVALKEHASNILTDNKITLEKGRKCTNYLMQSLLKNVSNFDPFGLNYLKDNIYRKKLENINKHKLKAKLQVLKSKMSEISQKDSEEYQKLLVSFKLLENYKFHLEYSSKAWDMLRSPNTYDDTYDEHLETCSYSNPIPSHSITLMCANDFMKFELNHMASRDHQKRKERMKFLTAILECQHKFVCQHNQKQSIIQNLNESLKSYFEKYDIERKKDEERHNRERMRHLMMEDEVGYRKLVDEKKDERLHYLLEKTDRFIDDISQSVIEHKSNWNSSQSMNIIDKKVNIPTSDNFIKEADIPYDDYYAVAHSIKETISSIPNILIGGKLKNYQIKGLEWLVSLYNNKLNGILADEMGLGKTIQTIALIAYLYSEKHEKGPFLIVVPLSTISNWQLEFEKWVPSIKVVTYKGSLSYRKALSAKLKQTNFCVLLTTYEYIIRDKSALSKIKWLYIIVDEGHRMKNRDSKITQTIASFYTSPYRLLLTGTPLQNKLPELWSLLNFLLPTIFNCSTTFEQWFNAPFVGAFDKIELNEEETVLVINRLHKILRPFLLRRVKKEVESQLPDKVEYVIPCAMSCLQQIIYKQMKDNNVLIGSSKDFRGHGSRLLMNTLMQLRKICSHPYLFEHIEDSLSDHFKSKNINEKAQLQRLSGKFELLDRILLKLNMTGHRVLLFSQMTSVLDILEQYLDYKGYKYLRLDGRTKSEDRSHMLSMFNSPESPYFVFIMSTRAGGLGLNLQTADTVILFDSDWNPQQDLQAQDRAHRIGQTNKVLVLRFITVHTVEERILSVARSKLALDGKIIQAGMFNQHSTDIERKAFLEKLFDDDHQAANEEMGNDVPDDENLNMMLARNDDELKIFQAIDNERHHSEQNLVASENSVGIYPRLITQEELPLWVQEADINFTAKHSNNEDSDVDQNGSACISDNILSRKRKISLNNEFQSMSD